MPRLLYSAMFFAIGLLAFPERAQAHALKMELQREPDRDRYRIHLFFDDGTNAQQTDVKVKLFADKTIVHEGKTDENGLYYFPMDIKEGFTVSAESVGHLATITVPKPSDLIPKAELSPDRGQNAIIGVSMLIGLFMVYRIMRTRRRKAI